MSGLYAIVDLPHPYGLGAAEVTTAVIAGRAQGGEVGADMVQLRAKGASTQQRRAYAEAMAPLCRAANVRLWINDDPDAVISDAHGLHLGQDDDGARNIAEVRRRLDRSDLGVGLSTHDEGQLRFALRQRPDYVAFGPILPTQSKANPDPTVGFAALTDACRIASMPVVAIGGLDETSGARAIAVGARWVATIGALVAPTVAETRERAEALSLEFARAAQPVPFEEVVRAIPVLPPEQLRELAAWSDSLGLHVELGLPARFRPRVEDGEVRYRPWDVLDLQFALGKDPSESWEQWHERAVADEIPSGLVQLRIK